jgi:hypothetical protein
MKTAGRLVMQPHATHDAIASTSARTALFEWPDWAGG